MEGINFEINSNSVISQKFVHNNCFDFVSASEFVRNLPYHRNFNKDNLLTIFDDHCGTCSTKHALLKKLSDENNQTNFKLILGIFRMNAENTPQIKSVLESYHLDYIPEAHNYLKINNQIFDYTKPSSSEEDFVNDLLEEIEIATYQINDFKIDYHQKYLKNWLFDNPKIIYSIEKIWKIREECIKALS